MGEVRLGVGGVREEWEWEGLERSGKGESGSGRG